MVNETTSKKFQDLVAIASQALVFNSKSRGEAVIITREELVAYEQELDRVSREVYGSSFRSIDELHTGKGDDLSEVQSHYYGDDSETSKKPTLLYTENNGLIRVFQSFMGIESSSYYGNEHTGTEVGVESYYGLVDDKPRLDIVSSSTCFELCDVNLKQLALVVDKERFDRMEGLDVNVQREILSKPLIIAGLGGNDGLAIRDGNNRAYLAIKQGQEQMSAYVPTLITEAVRCTLS